jgi:hypothetical protein
MYRRYKNLINIGWGRKVLKGKALRKSVFALKYLKGALTRLISPRE